MAKVYETVANQPTEAERDNDVRIATWKKVADTHRNPRKVRFAEKRMMHYKSLR